MQREPFHNWQVQYYHLSNPGKTYVEYAMYRSTLTAFVVSMSETGWILGQIEAVKR